MSRQVVFPLRVEHAQHDHALVIAHGIGADELLFGVVAIFQLFENCVAQLLAVKSLGLDSFGQNVHAEAGEDRVLQAFDVPVVRMSLDCRRTGPSDR